MRFLVTGFVVLTAIYALVSIYVWSVTRKRLEKEWAEEGSIGVRDDYVDTGMDDYARSIRPKLLFGIYIVPVIVFYAIF